MASKRTLRAVAPDEEPPPPVKPKTLTEAVEGGTYLEILVAQQRQIAADLPGEKGPAKAALHRQLALISKEIETLRAAVKQEAEENAAVEDQPFDASAI